ncbi:alpha-1A adrenergic receptor-like [Amphiura filiformis]|uniref:alpha-1A adrenergic receptor-like n=1 Tax=Amphiura filiformis TaxID=82378 RepID=UPI003B2161A5
MAVSNNTTGIDTFSPIYILNVPYWEQILVAVLLGLISITGLIGNSMIIAAVVFSKKLQTSTNAFVTNLSVADLMTSFVLIWYTVGTLGNEEWPIPRAYWICQFTGFMVYACIITSTWTLGAIAVDRLIRISKPMWYKKIFTSWKLVILVAITWVIPAACLLIPIATGDIAYGYSKRAPICTENKYTAEFSLVQNVLAVFPYLAIVGTYIWIYVYIKKHFREQKQHLSQLSADSATDNSQNYGTQSSTELAITDEDHDPNRAIAVQRQKRISKQEIVITKNLFMVVVAFFICFLPSNIFLSIRSTIDIEHYLFYAQLGPFANSAINFIIYASKHPDFKIVLRHMMRCSYADIPKPSPILKYLLSRRN